MPENFDYERLIVLLACLATLIVLNRDALARIWANLSSRRDENSR